MNYLFVLLLFIPFSTQAENYQWTDVKGKKHFSDKVHPDAKLLKLDPGYSYYQVKKVYDGDTILLANGTKVRLSGINTPEIERRRKPAQTGGIEAKHWLINKLKNVKVRLEKDIEKRDKYGRLLAHIFTDNKVHINLELVRAGLATVNIHPPNLKYVDELLKGQRDAEKAQSGIWNYVEYAPRQASNINISTSKGWQRIIGRIKNVRHTRKYSYLNCSDDFALKIERKYINLFPDLEHYIGMRIEARGWVNKHKKHYSMFIRHPSEIIEM
jgi:endonuclease YncB( thermonuclease family)